MAVAFVLRWKRYLVVWKLKRIDVVKTARQYMFDQKVGYSCRGTDCVWLCSCFRRAVRNKVETCLSSQVRQGYLDIYSLRLVSINGYRRLLSV